MYEVIAFILAAAASLGSPGPGITALMAIGMRDGFGRSLPFFFALQAGLAIAAGLSAAGLMSVLAKFPHALIGLKIVSVVYLCWLAWQIGTAPVGVRSPGNDAKFRPWGGFLLGIANPKAYLAFVSLYGSFAITAPAQGAKDAIAKWLILIAVMIVVDLAWLGAGAFVGRAPLSARSERVLNLSFACIIFALSMSVLFDSF